MRCSNPHIHQSTFWFCGSDCPANSSSIANFAKQSNQTMKKFTVLAKASIIIVPSLLVSAFVYADSESLSEVKIGVMSHDVKNNLKRNHEKGYNIIAEYVASNNYEFLRALPHIGFSISDSNYTSNVYTGLTWKFFLKRLPFGDKLFIELTFGVAINNSEIKTCKKRQAVGSHVLFRESLSVGAQINQTHNVSFMIDHVSNGRIIEPNPGITDVGIRYGITF